MSRRPVRGFTCHVGHRWTEANTRLWFDRSGRAHRQCRACANERARVRRVAAAAAQNERARARYAAGYRRPAMTPGDPRHGTTTGYNAGCREECCRSAIRESQRARKAELARRAELAKIVDSGPRSVAAVSLDERAERRFGLDRATAEAADLWEAS